MIRRRAAGVKGFRLGQRARKTVFSGGRAMAAPGEELFSCHEFFMKYPSLSGRGRSGAEDAPRLTRECSSAA